MTLCKYKKFNQGFARLGIAALVVWMAWRVLAYVVTGIPKLLFKYNFNYVEGMVADPIMRIQGNPWIYDSIHAEPFLLNPYHPLYHYISYVLMKMIGGIYLAPRLVGLTACILTALVLFLVMRKLAVILSASFVAVCIFLSVPIIQMYSLQARPDFLALLWVWLGVLFCIDREEKNLNQFTTLILPALFFSLAFWTKQNYVLASLSYAAFLFFSKRWKECVLFCCLMLIGVIPTWLFLNWITEGNFSEQTLSLSATHYSFQILYLNWKSFFWQYWILIIPALLVIRPSIRFASKNYMLIYLFTCALSTLSTGKTGFDTNHYIELTAITVVLVGVGLFKNQQAHQLKAFSWLLFLGIALYYPHDKLTLEHNSESALEVSSKSIDEIMMPLKNFKGKIISENIGWLVANGMTVWYEPFGYRQLAAVGKFDEGVILAKLKSGEYSALIMSINPGYISESSRFSKEFMNSVRENYALIEKRYNSYLLIHKSHFAALLKLKNA